VAKSCRFILGFERYHMTNNNINGIGSNAMVSATKGVSVTQVGVDAPTDNPFSSVLSSVTQNAPDAAHRPSADAATPSIQSILQSIQNQVDPNNSFLLAIEHEVGYQPTVTGQSMISTQAVLASNGSSSSSPQGVLVEQNLQNDATDTSKSVSNQGSAQTQYVQNTLQALSTDTALNQSINALSA
jgi:hypothetical protein